jgi:outer membrane receptor protein involved in Fe transport
MHRHLLLALAASASASAIAFAAPAFAADADTAAATPIGELVVTADKREEQIREVPMSITALPGDQLDKLVDRSFADYAALVPGLTLTPTQPGESRLTLRGLNAGGDASTVSVYVDESPFGSSSGLVNGSVLAGDFDTFDLQRIEVLRGPQGTLYGANSEGGLIKFVTNAPDPKAFSGALELGGQHVDDGSTAGSIDGMINMPISGDAALRISGFYEDLPGWIDDRQLGETDVNRGRKYGGRASFLFNANDNLSIRLTVFDQEIRNQGTPTVDVDPVTFQPAHGDLTQDRVINEPSSFSYRNYNATVNWNLGWANLTSSTSYGQNHVTSRGDVTPILGGVLPLLPLLDPTDFPSTPLGVLEDQQTNVDKFTQELRLTSSGSQPLEWQVGGFYTHETGLIKQVIPAFLTHAGIPFGPPLEAASIASRYEEYAAFASATYHFNQAFDIQLGGRYSHNNQTGTETLGGLPFLIAPTQFTVPSSQGVFNYSVAPQWHLTDSTMLYARVSSGYRPGGPNVVPPSAPPSTPRSYQSDSTTNYEAGVKTALFGGRLSLDVTAFLIDWNNIQLLEVINQTGVNANGGKARSDGVEWDATLAPFRGLTLTVSGAYTDATLTSPAPALAGLPGDRLPYTPPLNLTLDGEYDWSLSGETTAFLGATFAYVGGRTTDLGPGRTEIASYDTLDLRAGVAYRRWRLQVYAKNATNTRGIADLSPTGAISGGNRGAVIIQPATIGTTLSASF